MFSRFCLINQIMCLKPFLKYYAIRKINKQHLQMIQPVNYNSLLTLQNITVYIYFLEVYY